MSWVLRQALVFEERRCPNGIYCFTDPKRMLAMEGNPFGVDGIAAGRRPCTACQGDCALPSSKDSNPWNCMGSPNQRSNIPAEQSTNWLEIIQHLGMRFPCSGVLRSERNSNLTLQSAIYLAHVLASRITKFGLQFFLQGSHRCFKCGLRPPCIARKQFCFTSQISKSSFCWSRSERRCFSLSLQATAFEFLSTAAISRELPQNHIQNLVSHAEPFLSISKHARFDAVARSSFMCAIHARSEPKYKFQSQFQIVVKDCALENGLGDLVPCDSSEDYYWELLHH